MIASCLPRTSSHLLHIQGPTRTPGPTQPSPGLRPPSPALAGEGNSHSSIHTFSPSFRIRGRNSPNGDGLDFDGCRRARIRDCDLDTGDDAIGPKTFQPDAPNEDFEISGCRISARWAAVRIGAESIAPMRRLTVRDCRFTKCQAGIKIESSEGRMFDDLHFAGIEMKDVCQPFMVLASRFAFSAHNTSARPPVGRIRRVRFENLRAEVRAAGNVGMVDNAADQDPFGRACSAVASHPDARIEDITATRNVANPYTDTEVWAEFTHDDGTNLCRPMFWDGGRTLRVRFASTKPSGVCLSWTAPGRDGAALPHGTVSGLKRGCVSCVLETQNSLRSSQVFRRLVSGFQGLYGAKREG